MRLLQNPPLYAALLFSTIAAGCATDPGDDSSASAGTSDTTSAGASSSGGTGNAAGGSSSTSSGAAAGTSATTGMAGNASDAGGSTSAAAGASASGGTNSGGTAGSSGSIGVGGSGPCVTVSGAPSYTGQIGMYSGGPVGPVVKMDCDTDPSAGWTEYKDTFNVEHPYDLKATDRFSVDCGVYTFWVLPTDKPHEVGNDTAPRTEARWSNFTSSNPHMWSADVLIESPSDHVTVMQVHTTASGAGPVYLRVDQNTMLPLNGSVFFSGFYDKWFNMKVAFDPSTLKSTVYINNCAKQTFSGPAGNMVNYFKNGVYTCTSSVCRDHYKNFHLFTKP